MVVKRGPRGMGCYRDVFKVEVNLALHLPATADAAPVMVKLDELLAEGRTKAATG